MKKEDKKNRAPVITIDGPSASGKTTVSCLLAKELGWSWVSTGAFYRGLAFVADQVGVSWEDSQGLSRLAESDIWRVEMTPETTQIFWNNQEITARVTSERVGAGASQISRHPKVRASLLDAQRRCRSGVPGLVAEGRDCGTVVFPDAPLKIYLTARVEDRAARRALDEGSGVHLIRQAQEKRDEQDRSRGTAPLAIPPDGVVIDSSDLTVNEVVARILSLYRN